jgi:hypothetical protein
MRITKETQAQLGGDRNVLCLSLLQGESRKQVLTFTKNNVPIDITNFTFEFKLIERSAAYISDTKNGINIVGLGTKPGAVAFDLDTYVYVTDAVNGIGFVHIPTIITAVEPSDPDSTMPIVYTGYLTVKDNASVGPAIQKIQFLILVSNDGV